MRIVTRLGCSLLCTVVAVGVMGCRSSSSESSSSSTSQEDSDGGIHGTIPPTSKFAKLEIGMSQQQVMDLIGPPTDTQSYTTGKQWNPFYFGNDAARMEMRYKSEGCITFTGVGIGGSHLTVYRIEYDPKEFGYCK